MPAQNPLRLALIVPLTLCAAGCPPTRPTESVTARLPAPLENRWVEAAVRAVPGVSEVEVRPNSPSYTLTGQRIPTRDTIVFRAPGLSGAFGSVGQDVDAKDRTTTTVTALATWIDHHPTAQDKREASQTLRELMGWILLTARDGQPTRE